MMMKKYIVGGWVRDKLLGLNPRDRDWLIVGAQESDIEYLKSIGYEQVGKDFPVFISPDGEEYALARIERKIGEGYTGFECSTKDVTVQDDLLRRDFTINSICYDPVLEIYVDPYGGRDDIKNKVIRHTSDAFSEDPLRVLRLSRFYARLEGFSVHPSTAKLAKTLIDSGALQSLSADRIYIEFHKAFSSSRPEMFIHLLNNMGYMKQKFPNINISPETLKTFKVISSNCTPKYSSAFLWCALLDQEKIVKNRYESLPFSTEITSFVEFIQNHSKVLHKFSSLNANDMCKYFTEVNFKNKGSEEFIYKVTEYLMLTGIINSAQEEFIIKAFDVFDSTNIPDIKKMVQEGTLQNSEIKNYVFELHLESLKKFLK